MEGSWGRQSRSWACKSHRHCVLLPNQPPEARTTSEMESGCPGLCQHGSRLGKSPKSALTNAHSLSLLSKSTCLSSGPCAGLSLGLGEPYCSLTSFGIQTVTSSGKSSMVDLHFLKALWDSFLTSDVVAMTPHRPHGSHARHQQ